jgi:enamine deaminase RidA (YjgF/YER057c/UK114 family)
MHPEHFRDPVAAGSSIGKVVKVNVFLTDMDNFAEMNAMYESIWS